MARLALPSPNVPLTRGNDPRINNVWYKKFRVWILRTNQGALGADGKLTVAVTSDTNIRFSYRGSDGVTRTADITLS